jgi:hypothetical protein
MKAPMFSDAQEEFILKRAYCRVPVTEICRGLRITSDIRLLSSPRGEIV